MTSDRALDRPDSPMKSYFDAPISKLVSKLIIAQAFLLGGFALENLLKAFLVYREIHIGSRTEGWLGT